MIQPDDHANTYLQRALLILRDAGAEISRLGVYDEYDPSWDLGATEQTIRASFKLIERINRDKAPPKWKRMLPFPVEP